MGTILGYMIGALVLISLLLGGALYLKDMETKTLIAEKARVEGELVKVEEINAKNEETMKRWEAHIAKTNDVLLDNQKQLLLLSSEIDTFREEVLNDVPETNVCAQSPAVSATLDWLQQRAKGRGAKPPHPAAGSVIPVPVPRPTEGAR